jgi:hypothetical protein
MCIKTNNALVNHLCATSPVVRLQCFHPWRTLFEFNFWQFFFSIFQLFLVLLLSHVMCRFEPCLCRNFSHFYESSPLQFFFSIFCGWMGLLSSHFELALPSVFVDHHTWWPSGQPDKWITSVVVGRCVFIPVIWVRIPVTLLVLFFSELKQLIL